MQTQSITGYLSLHVFCFVFFSLFFYIFSLFSISDGCPGLCSGHGRCTLEQSGWRCVCQTGWSGPGCSVVMETDCSDGADNDGGDISNIIYHLLPLYLSLCFFGSSYTCVRSSPPSRCLLRNPPPPPLPPRCCPRACGDSCPVLRLIMVLNMYQRAGQCAAKASASLS